MVVRDGIAESSAVAGWSEALGKLHERIGRRFARSEARDRVKRYLVGLLGRIERKNGWQMAEAIGETDPQGVQRLLNSANWDADAVRDDLREYVVEHLADEESGVLIVDETGFLKKGEKSVGVARQYTGTAGDTVNCQVGVFLAYASEKGAAFVDRALYLPKAWTSDSARRAEAGVPEGLVFWNKIELAELMLERAFEAGVPARWVAADSFYGRSHEFREWLEERDPVFEDSQHPLRLRVPSAVRRVCGVVVALDGEVLDPALPHALLLLVVDPHAAAAPVALVALPPVHLRVAETAQVKPRQEMMVLRLAHATGPN